jgi:hypothetical protein
MITEITPVNKFILAENKQYSYTVQPFELTNILGAVVAVLDEYFIINSNGETYKLYKTHDGNWYDMPEANKDVDKSVLLGLKLGIDSL